MLPLVLASSSPARRMLMDRLQLPYKTISPNIDETPLPHEQPETLVARLTQAKAEAVRLSFPDHCIISADQVIVVQGEAISKPETKEEAMRQLTQESGQWVEALSGLGVLDTHSGNFQYACIKTRVLFQTLDKTRILDYLFKDPEAIYCAGSLRVEALGISLLEKIESDDPTALIGLPLIKLCQMLRNIGYTL